MEQAAFQQDPPRQHWRRATQCRNAPGTTGNKAQATHHHTRQCPTASPATLHPSVALFEGSKAGACWREDFAPGLPSTWMSSMNGCPMSSVRVELLTMELPYGHSSFSTPSSRCVDRPNPVPLTRHSKLTPGQTGQAAAEVKDLLRSDKTVGHKPLKKCHSHPSFTAHPGYAAQCQSQEQEFLNRQ